MEEEKREGTGVTRDSDSRGFYGCMIERKTAI